MIEIYTIHHRLIVNFKSYNTIDYVHNNRIVLYCRCPEISIHVYIDSRDYLYPSLDKKIKNKKKQKNKK